MTPQPDACQACDLHTTILVPKRVAGEEWWVCPDPVPCLHRMEPLGYRLPLRGRR